MPQNRTARDGIGQPSNLASPELWHRLTRSWHERADRNQRLTDPYPRQPGTARVDHHHALAAQRQSRPTLLGDSYAPTEPMRGAARNRFASEIRESSERPELNIDRRRRVDERAEFQPASDWVDTEYRDVVRILVGGIEERSRRIDVHPARPLPAGRTPNRSFRVRRFPARSRTSRRCHDHGSSCRGNARSGGCVSQPQCLCR